MRFYAHMHGVNIGSLTVLITKKGSSGVTYPVIAYHRYGHQSKDWFEVMVDLPVEQSFSVSITCFDWKCLNNVLNTQQQIQSVLKVCF